MFWFSGLLLLQKKKLKRKTHKQIEKKREVEQENLVRPFSVLHVLALTTITSTEKANPNKINEKKTEQKMKVIKSPHPS
jgi:hypothetical protein